MDEQFRTQENEEIETTDDSETVEETPVRVRVGLRAGFADTSDFL